MRPLTTRTRRPHYPNIPQLSTSVSASSTKNLVQIQNGTFYREHPSSIAGSQSSSNPPLFLDWTFSLPATAESEIGQPLRRTQHWAVIAASGATSLLNAVKGSLLCLPPQARSFPYLSSEEISRKDPRLRIPSRAIQYVGFSSGSGSDGMGGGVRGAYLSARYESRREATDWSVMQYLKGETELNPSEELQDKVTDMDLLHRVIRDLKLEKLVNMPVSNLSNGQTRRSRIAKALLSRPELLLLDEPFMGLDPPTLVTLSPILRDLAYRSSPLLMLALRPQDPIPDWITHLVVLGKECTIALQGERDHVLFALQRWVESNSSAERGEIPEGGLHSQALRALNAAYGPPLSGVGEILSSRGVYHHNLYSKAHKAFAGENSLFEQGLVRPDLLDENESELLLPAYRKTEEQRTTQDWIALATVTPARISETMADPSEISTSAQHIQQSTSENPSSSTSSPAAHGEPLIELSSVIVKYGNKTVLGHPPPQPGFSSPGLNLTIRRGTRMALLGPNGSGKTTLLSLLTSDHPQSYSLPIQFFGRSRLPTPGVPGLSLWEIQSRIGHSSPEVHSFFPKAMSIRGVLQSAWAETFSSKPDLTPERRDMADLFLRHWEPELCQVRDMSSLSTKPSIDSEREGTKVVLSWADDRVHHRFGTLPFGIQRLLLFLRAIIKEPDIIILDEAFSGLPLEVRDKALAWLESGTQRPDSTRTESRPDEHTPTDTGATSTKTFTGLTSRQALIVVSHVREEVPQCVSEYVRLPSEEEALEMGKGVLIGRIHKGEKGGGIRTVEGWNAVWGL